MGSLEDNMRNSHEDTLMEIVTIKRGDYTDEAISFAESELTKRGISFDTKKRQAIETLMVAKENADKNKPTLGGQIKRLLVYTLLLLGIALFHVLIKSTTRHNGINLGFFGALLVYIPFYFLAFWAFSQVKTKFRP